MTDPAAAWQDRRRRAAAWDAWEAAGGNLADLPAGLLSASLDRCLNRGRHADRWKR